MAVMSASLTASTGVTSSLGKLLRTSPTVNVSGSAARATPIPPPIQAASATNATRTARHMPKGYRLIEWATMGAGRDETNPPAPCPQTLTSGTNTKADRAGGRPHGEDAMD